MRRLVLLNVIIGLCSALAVSPIISLASSMRDKEPVSNTKPLASKFTPSNNKPARPLRAQFPTLAIGQSSTLLPDGSWLLVGGSGPQGPTNVASIVDPYSGASVELSARLHSSREWHSSTMLPDGKVLILGGIGINGRVVNRVEVYNPQTRAFELAAPYGWPSPRAYHSSTLLPDGRLLIAGGVSARGESSGEGQLWDSKTGAAENLPGLNLQRRKHRATLLGDGSVLFEGGSDTFGNESNSPEIFSSQSKSFHAAVNVTEEANDNPASLALSLPGNGTTDIEIDSRIALLFSRRLRADTVNSETVTLSSPDGTIRAKVIPTESGKSAFLTPDGPLDPHLTYTVLVAGPLDTRNRSVTPTAITFTTSGTSETQGGPAARGARNANLPDNEKWMPDSNNLNGNWHSNYADTHWQKLPPLQAAAGVTALAGQVLTLDGKPLQNATLRIAGSFTRSDNTGRFLLQPINAGHQVLIVDGRTAGNSAKTYGVFRVGVDITGGKTEVLGFTFWMPKLDMDHAITIPSPTTTEVIATHPLIPGLELRLPAGTVIRGIDGETVTQISITPIPVDRPPFPLPSGVNVPVFFTIQPGGARIYPPNARVIYPNYTHQLPGSRIDFWNYDPSEKGWHVYGRGIVTEDGRQVIPDPGVNVYEFSGIMINTGEVPPAEGPVPCDPCEDGEPVNLGTGLFIQQKSDLVLPDLFPLVLSRTYRAKDTASRPFGIGATHRFQMFLWSAQQYREADLILPDGGRVHFDRVSGGTGVSNAVFRSTTHPGMFYNAELRWMGDIAPDPAKIEMWHLTLQDGTVYVFGENAPLQRIRDSYGNTINISRAGVNQFGSPIGNITKVTSPSGKYIEFTYDAANRIKKASDNIGREVNYTYDASGRLWKVTDAKNGVTEYTYDASHRMLTIKDPRGIVYITNEYDANGRVSKQTMADDTPANNADNPIYQFAYTTDSGGKITQTEVTDQRTNVRRVTFNSKGYWLTNSYAFGKPQQQTYTAERQVSTNLILSTTDPMGRKTAYTYDSQGRVTSVTDLALTIEAVTTRYSYDSFGRTQPARITDTLGRTTSFAYHDKGALLSRTDSLGRRVTSERNENGLLTVLTDPSGNTTQFEYHTKVFLSVRDHLGRGLRRSEDAAGRTLRAVDAMGQSARFEYDQFNQVVKITDPFEGVTEFTYDPNGNLLIAKDARQNITTFTYDNMDRLQTRNDQFQGTSSTESYGYDLKGNLLKFTDRRGKITIFGYDDLDRLNFVGFGEMSPGVYESTINYTYDAGNRLRTAVDSASGTIVLDYDNFDRLISVTTSQGTVNYGYDKVGRRTTMTVLGQPIVNYTYDNADRLTSVTQGAATVSFTHDESNRLATKTLPNGVVAEYDYDAVSQLTSITYKLNGIILGDLTYEYDQTGKRTKLSGTLARIDLPQPLISAAYDTANRLVQRGATNFSYDANGNLISDGSNTYTWNARNQLSSIAGNVTATFQYDAFGRRFSKAIDGVSTSYLHDGADVVQEMSGGTPSANLLLGGLDRIFTRTDSAGARALITDVLGSTLGLVNDSGQIQTEYTYDPFGNTSTTGALSSNQSQYTGRESDGTGLYFYRSRYYSPTLQRFIAEDPVGFAGGEINLYSYVGNDPINFKDPFGLQGGPEDLGLGYSARVDAFSSGEGFEIHVFNPKGEEIGICSGRQGWIAKHGHPAAVPPGTPRDVLNKLNGINLSQLRARGLVPPKGTANVNVSGGRYLAGGRTLFSAAGVAGAGLQVAGEFQAQGDLEMRARKNGLTPEQQFYRDSEMAGHPDYYMTPFGPMRNPYAGGFNSPFVEKL